MKKASFWAIILLSSVAISCKKSDPTPTPPAAVKFMSLTAGSTWNYKLTNNLTVPAAVTNYTLTASSQDSVANSKTYKVFTSPGRPNEYYNITGSDYYTYRTLPASLGGSSVEVLYLKDNLAVGETWSQTAPISVSGFTLNLTLNNKISQKGISKTVNGIVYTDVTDVETTLSVTGIPFAYTLTTDIHYYYAPKVGQIENKTKIDLTITGFPPNNFDQKTELQSSNIL
jgi:predicted membrane-bound mannosyltransferase